MNECAIVRNGKDIIKVSNLKRKYNKIINNPQMEILEECSKEQLEEIYNKYKIIPTNEVVEDKPIQTKTYYWNVPRTRIWCTSNDIENFKLSSKWRDDYILSTREKYCECFGIKLHNK